MKNPLVVLALLASLTLSPHSLLAQEQPATIAGSTPTTTSAPAIKTMRFQFVDASVDTILSEMATHFGFIIIKSQPIPGRITIHVPEPLTAPQAIRLLNSILVPMGHAVIETQLPGGGEGPIRVGTREEAKRVSPVIKVEL